MTINQEALVAARRAIPDSHVMGWQEVQVARNAYVRGYLEAARRYATDGKCPATTSGAHVPVPWPMFGSEPGPDRCAQCGQVKPSPEGEA